MSDEAARHTRTWMAFGANEKSWGRKRLPQVRNDLATIARTISRYEPVSMLVRPGEIDLARTHVGPGIELIACPLDALWIRDTGPTFVLGESADKGAIDFNCNSWGKKQAFRQDARVSSFVAKKVGVRRIATDLVLEGGCLEVDGARDSAGARGGRLIVPLSHGGSSCPRRLLRPTSANG